MKVSSYHTFKRLILLPGLLLWLSGCSVATDINNKETGDFGLSKVLSATQVLADGTSQMEVKILLKHSDGTLATDLVPTLSQIPPGVILDGCTPTDSSGISTCKLRSTTPGTQNITFTLAQTAVQLSKDVTFSASIRSDHATAIASTELLKQTAAGYTVYSTTSSVSPSKEVNSGYSIQIQHFPYGLVSTE